MKIKIAIMFLVLCSFFIAQIASAVALPLPGVEIILKSVKSKMVTMAKADNDGNFSTTVKEESGLFDIYIGDQNSPPVKIVSKNFTISGRVVILTDGTTTKDPEPVVKKVTTKKKITTLLKEGAECKTSSQCAKGLKCAYPCGIPGCKNVCMKESDKLAP